MEGSSGSQGRGNVGQRTNCGFRVKGTPDPRGIHVIYQRPATQGLGLILPDGVRDAGYGMAISLILASFCSTH